MMQCFYCGAPVIKGGYQMDHFPVPKECGGKETVCACHACHSIKDRLDAMELASSPMFAEFTREFATLGRATKLMMAKMLRLYHIGLHRRTMVDARMEAANG